MEQMEVIDIGRFQGFFPGKLPNSIGPESK
jgi:hypothetical protein